MAVETVQRVDLLGGFRLVTTTGTPIRLPTARQQQLLAFLALFASAAPVPRQRVAGSLWPESTDAQALTNLRRELHHLREQAPALDALIESGARALMWSPASRATVDLVAFERAAERGLQGDRASLEEAARLYQGDLLPSCDAEWIVADRHRLRDRARAVLSQLIATLERERAFGDAIDRAQQLLRLDPLDEPAWCSLMRSHARRGDRATALHVYQQCAAHLKQELGIQPSAATRMTYREILDLDAEVPSSPPPRITTFPLVGREGEWQTLVSAWRGVDAGRAKMIVIRGEAGIGKTRLAEELVEWCQVKGIVTLVARCPAGEGRLAYAPIASWLKDDRLQHLLLELEPPPLSDIARLHPEVLARRPEVPPPDRQLETWQRLRFFEALAQAFRAAAPAVLVVDDLQWSDADTVEWLHYFLRSSSDRRVMVVATVRAEEEQDNRPLVRLLEQLSADEQLGVIQLGRLDQAATAQLAKAVAEAPLDEASLARAFQETEGHPLFIVERGRMGEAPVGDAAPSRVQSVVAARISRLSEGARLAAEVASAIGRDFRFDILAHASDLEEDALVRALDELWQRQIVRVQADERWDFSHDRIREVAYSGIGPARARLIHRRIAQGMELLFADRLDEVSASIAMHLDRGGQAARAVPFLERAAAVAARVSASEEAIHCLGYALSLLERLPAGPERDERELTIRSSLSVVLNSARGYGAPEVEHNLDRVFHLAQARHAGVVPVRWLWVAFTMRFMLGDLKTAREVSERAFAQSDGDPACRCEANHAMGGILQNVGELDASRRHFEAALDAYDERYPQKSALGSDLGVFGHAWFSHTLWLLGDEPAALRHAEDSIALAERLHHPYSQTLAYAYSAMLHQMRRDAAAVDACATAAVDICKRYGFGYYGDWGRVLLGWVRGLDRPAEGVALIEEALRQLDAQRAQARRPFYLSLLAETYRRNGQLDRATAVVSSAIAIALERSDLWWLPAIYLEKSQLLSGDAREDARRRGLDLARTQGNRGLERRILTDSAAAVS
ncbi:MAG TPA: AAA family ATPase [Vicinamibacterales bacterium]|nr:AAA family ATPase [Vicinamibacterales bacterium]